MYDLDFRVTGEIRLVQSENMRNRVNLHRGGKPGIVDLHSANTIAHNQVPPDPIDLFIVWKQSHDALDGVDACIRFLNGQAKTIVAGWSRANVPKLTYILRRIAELDSVSYEDISSGLYQRIVRIVFF